MVPQCLCSTLSFQLYLFTDTEGGFSLLFLYHTFAPSLVLYVLGMVFLCCFGPASVFGRLCISGLQGFTAPSLPSYGILCFVSVEGLVRIRASSPAWKISNSIVSRSYLGLGIFSDPCLELRGIFPLSSKPSSVFIHALGVMVCCQCSRCLKVLKGVSVQEVGFHLSLSGA